jgi:ketosteroid isomerase-like protein
MLSLRSRTVEHPRGFDRVAVRDNRNTMNTRRLSLTLLSILIATAAFAADPAAEVRALEREWLDAYEKYDAAAMKRIVADDFTIYFGDGSMQTKADILAMVARGAGKPGPRFTTEDVLARVYGETVILTGRVVTEMKRADGSTSRSASRYTDTYVRRNGKWQVVASHLGAEKTPPAAKP